MLKKSDVYRGRVPERGALESNGGMPAGSVLSRGERREWTEWECERTINVFHHSSEFYFKLINEAREHELNE